MSESNVFDVVFDPLEFKFEPKKAALLVIDMQYLSAHADYGLGADARRRGVYAKYDYFFSQLNRVVLPNIIALLAECRVRRIERIFTRTASAVEDCRDVSLSHKRVRLFAPFGSKESEILDELKPESNELVLSKGASGVFNATAIDQILRNMGVETLIVTGSVTNYCVETAVRDAGDRGYNVILVHDACAAMTEEHQKLALDVLGGVYCRLQSTSEVLKELANIDRLST